MAAAAQVTEVKARGGEVRVYWKHEKGSVGGQVAGFSSYFNFKVSEKSSC